MWNSSRRKAGKKKKKNERKVFIAFSSSVPFTITAHKNSTFPTVSPAREERKGEEDDKKFNRAIWVKIWEGLEAWLSRMKERNFRCSCEKIFYWKHVDFQSECEQFSIREQIYISFSIQTPHDELCILPSRWCRNYSLVLCCLNSIFHLLLFFFSFLFPSWVNRVCDSSIQYLIFSHFSNTLTSTRLPLGIFHRDWDGWWLTAEQSEKASKKKAIRKRTEQEKKYDWITNASGCSGGHTKNWNSKSRIVSRIILCPFRCWIDQILISISFQFTSSVTYMLEPHYSSFRIGFSVSLQAPHISYTQQSVWESDVHWSLSEHLLNGWEEKWKRIHFSIFPNCICFFSFSVLAARHIASMSFSFTS